MCMPHHMDNKGKYIQKHHSHSEILTIMGHTNILKLFPQLLNLRLELSQQGILWVLIHASTILYILGTVCIAQRADGLVIIEICWPYVGTLDIDQKDLC